MWYNTGMPTAYTPGLQVTDHTIIHKVRRLPLKGEVLVKAGQRVTADEVVARALLPGNIQAVRAAEKLGTSPAELQRLLKKHENETVHAGELLAETKGFLGLFGARLTAPVDGTIEYISPLTGTIGIREHPVPLNLAAHIAGTVEEVMPEEGITLITEGALVQGIFGVGGERRGKIKTVAPSANAPLDESRLGPDCAGCVLLGGASVNVAQIRKAVEFGAVGLIVGAVSDAVLRAYLGYDVGVAITGQEDIQLTLILTEGFGSLAMAQRTFDLLDSLQGMDASINGATQIRAGVIRPEIIVPERIAPAHAPSATHDSELRVGARIRLIREPFFGRFATVTAMPAELHKIETEAMVRVAEVTLEDDGTTALVPRANVEIIQE
ncbi:MAG: hypothetical protein ACYDBB_17945 [Armatimonadota bacterium]